MSLKSYLFILFLIFCSSVTSVGLLLFYMNPESDTKMALGLMGTGVFLTSSSFLSIFLFFLKKIYYRGDVSLHTMNASLRQAILLSIGGILIITLQSLHISEPRLIITVWLTLGCLEVMIQAVD